jgi:hypothetical protein
VLVVRPGPTLTRAVFAGLLALLLAVRLLAPAGFMPAFEHGSVTIVPCPDADSRTVPAAPMHHQHGNLKHEQCPYAAASAVGSLGTDFIPLIGVLVFGAALLIGRTFLFLESNSLRQRPPTRAPPIPA